MTDDASRIAYDGDGLLAAAEPAPCCRYIRYAEERDPASGITYVRYRRCGAEAVVGVETSPGAGVALWYCAAHSPVRYAALPPADYAGQPLPPRPAPATERFRLGDLPQTGTQRVYLGDPDADTPQ